MGTLLTLAKRMRTLAQQEKRLASDLAAAFAEELVVRLTEETPVDTSKAVSNWQVTLGDPTAHEIEALYPGSKKSTMSQSVAEARRRAVRILKGKKIGQKIYISNTASYIGDLNDGNSKQAPAGFIQSTIFTSRRAIPGLLRALRNGRRKS
jgi:rubrerythrin